MPRLVGEALSLPKLTQLSSSLNVERLRRSGRLLVDPKLTELSCWLNGTGFLLYLMRFLFVSNM